MAKTLLVTGSSGLIGSEVCVYFASLGYTVHGVDNNQRAVFFGPSGDTRWNQQRLARVLKGFVHHELDIRDRAGVLALVKTVKPSVIVHAAAQPSHDRAAPCFHIFIARFVDLVVVILLFLLVFVPQA